MSAGHTPGPWFAVGYPVEIESETVADICTTNAHLFGQPGLHDDARAMANARLIAAAPNLLAALENLLADAVEMGLDDSPVSGTRVYARNALRHAGVL